MSELAGELTDLVRGLAQDPDAAWPQVQKLGLAGIGIPEESGGSGGQLADLMLVIRELSRAGLSTPIVEASTAAFAIGPADEGFDTVAVGAPGVVPFADGARRLVILADAGVSVLNLSDARVEPVVDIAGQPAGRVQVSAATALDGVTVAPVLERLALARSSALLGSAWGAYELTRRYVIERQQFGAPLIDITSVAGGLASMVIQIRAAQAAVDRAVSAAEDATVSSQSRSAAIAAARIAAAQMATVVARTSHQLHGAMGITSEYPLHRYTTALWAMRDADLAEQDWSRRLGAVALSVDEDVLWNELTA